MRRRSAMDEIRLPSHGDLIPAVTILDGEGRMVRVVPGDEFRRGRSSAGSLSQAAGAKGKHARRVPQTLGRRNDFHG